MLHIPIYFLIDVLLHGNGVKALIVQSCISLIAYLGYSAKSNGASLSKDLTAISVVLTPAVLVFVFEGHEWQIDAHMYFFATMAMVVGLKSIRAAIAAAAAVAAHHLILNFALPSLVFPDGETDFFRVVFHAIIVVVETGVIILTIKGLNDNDAKISQESEAAKAALKKVEEAEAEKLIAEKRNEEKRKQALNQMATDLENSILDVAKDVESNANVVLTLSNSVADVLNESKAQGDVVDHSAREVSENVQTVASATEELSASIREISANVASTANVSQLCADDAEISKEKLSHLQGSVDEIDVVIQSINDVAEQTNLLALNATIEAARAGEAGKGFAVVASEVKNLASETHQMTEEISGRVNSIKDSTTQAITTIEGILERILDVNGQAAGVASAVEQQNSATAEISKNIQHVSTGTQLVSTNMNSIQEFNTQVISSTDELKVSSSQLASLSTQLNETVEVFLKGIREN